MLTAQRRQPIVPALRGFSAIYRPNETNHCPGCGRTHWLVGRITVECAFCATALPMIDPQGGAAPRIIHRHGR